MLARSFKKADRLIFSRRFTTETAQPWKQHDFYYNYEFKSKMEFIDHKIRFPLFRVMDVEGKLLAPEYDTLDKAFLLSAFDTMVTCREMDVIYNIAQRQNRITFHMPSTFEEATDVGAISGIKDSDALFWQNREFPMLMRRGITTLDHLNNLKGNCNDKTLGRCLGLMNANREKNIFPNSAPLGNRNPHAAGAGYFFRVKNMDKIAMCTFGEGSASEGDVHASMNFAATLGCQTLFFCRNNSYAISTPRHEQYAGDGVAPRGIGYGIPAIKVDGSDLLAVYHAVKKSREIIMERKGPVIVEAYTYRGGDHSTSDSAATYRTPEVMGPILKYVDAIGDPIDRLAKFMQNKGFIKDYKAHHKAVAEKARAECLENLRINDRTKMPYYALMFDDVYKERPWNIKEQAEELMEHLKRHPEAYPLDEFPPK